MRACLPLLATASAAFVLPWAVAGSATDSGPQRSAAESNDAQAERFFTDRASPVALPLPAEDEAFQFAIFGDRTGGPASGVEILAEAVEEVNLLKPDLVMTVGDLVEGYNEKPEWMEQMREFRGIMNGLDSPWFPVAGNHDVYWRGEGEPPPGGHEADYEMHFGPLWYAFRHKGCWFVVLYSDEGDPETGEKNFNKPSCQRMSPEQYAWLAGILERTDAGEPVFLFLHHPRWLGDNYGDDWERVHELLAASGNVRAVFAGHIHHMRYDGVRDGIEYFTLATVGGGQSGRVPEAGYLHQYHLVTVRDGEISLGAYPVGAAMDPRAISGAISDEVYALAGRLRPRPQAAVVLDEDLGYDGELAFAVDNPSSRPIEVELLFGAPGWTFLPDHRHARIPPGDSRRFLVRAQRPAGGLEFFDGLPAVRLRADYLGEGLRVRIPEKRAPLDLRAPGLPAPPRPETESALRVADGNDHLRVVDDELALPQGPFTVEGWLRADEFRRRQGFVNKTEGSEFGFFVNGGRPEFMVHDGAYRIARAAEPVLEPGRWHHLAGVYDGTEVRLYVDGRRAAATAAGAERTRNALPLLVGADVDGDGRATSPCPGWIDEVRISTGARYAGESFTPRRRFQADEHTVLLLHMDAESGPWVHDASPAHAHAVRRGGVRIAAVPEAGDGD